MHDAMLVCLSIKGFAKPEALAFALDADAVDVERTLERLEAAGSAERTKIGWRASASGKAAAARTLADERARLAPGELAGAYERFTVLNDRFKAIVMAWQIRRIGGTEVPNDHTDAAYDNGILGDIEAVDRELAELLEWLSEAIPRTAPYRRRFARALENARRGELRFVAAPIIDSYHTVWFELHEELIRLSGTTREAEAAAGRGA